MTAPIGEKYQRRNITLSRGTDWVGIIEPRDAEGNPLPTFGWPAGTRVLLVLGELVSPTAQWEAVVAPDRVSWRVESTEADVIPADTAVRAQVVFPGTPTTELPWFKGKVVRDD